MGFTDVQKNEQALIKYGGTVVVLGDQFIVVISSLLWFVLLLPIALCDHELCHHTDDATQR
jgi:hypothetical protein